MDDMEQIYRQHARTVYRFLLAQCGDAGLAEELTQETFYQAMRSIGRYDGSCKLSVWLCQIARHLWYQQLRRRGREAPMPDEPPERPVPSAEEETLDRHARLGLVRQVHDLPEPYREVVYLRAFGQLSFREIGDVLGKTENWARVTFYRGKEKLKGDAGHEK